MTARSRSRAPGGRALWGDLIRGAPNASVVGTLDERKSLFVLLAKVDGVDAEAVLKGFTHRLRTLSAGLRETLTYDQGRELARHQELARRVRIRVYFVDPPTLSKVCSPVSACRCRQV